jgi:hypothetical protein
MMQNRRAMYPQASLLLSKLRDQELFKQALSWQLPLISVLAILLGQPSLKSLGIGASLLALGLGLRLVPSIFGYYHSLQNQNFFIQLCICLALATASNRPSIFAVVVVFSGWLVSFTHRRKPEDSRTKGFDRPAVKQAHLIFLISPIVWFILLITWPQIPQFIASIFALTVVLIHFRFYFKRKIL